MINSYLGEINDKHAVLAIDAASVSARVSVYSNDEAKCLLRLNGFNDSKKVLSTPYEFSTFVSSHEHEIIRYFFVVYVYFLYLSAKSFPIELIPKYWGNDNKEIVENFKNIVKYKINVVGVALDGDSVWLHLAKKSVSTNKNVIVQFLLENEKCFIFYNIILSGYNIGRNFIWKRIYNNKI